jgi:O-succinylbenzoate synthase
MMLQAGLPSLGRLEAVELWRGDVALGTSLRAAHGVHDALVKLYVRLVCEAGEGWGEVAAIERPVGLDPSTDDVATELIRHWFPRLGEAAGARGGRCPPSQSATVLGGSRVVDRVAGSAVEMAVLDAELRLQDRSLASWLGLEVTAVHFGGLVGIPERRDPSAALEAAARLIEAGAARLRVKIDPSFNRGPLTAIAEAYPGIALHADANGSFGEATYGALRVLDDLGLACIEQPVATRDLAAVAQLAATFTTPFCLDETITSRRVARDAIRYGACRVLCVKPARVGGLRAAVALVEESAASGAQSFIGGMFETGLGRAYLGAIAALGAVALVSDVVAPCSYLLEDPCDLPGPVAGLQPIYSEPGVGPWPAPRSISKVAESRF